MGCKRWIPVTLAVLAAGGIAGCGEEASSQGEDRGRRAVGVCEGRGGVVAFEDDVVICRDQSFHEVKE